MLTFQDFKTPLYYTRVVLEKKYFFNVKSFHNNYVQDALIKHCTQNDDLMVVFMAKIWPLMAK